MKKFLKEIYTDLKNHDLFNLSANISFFAIVSLFPLIMILVSVMGYFMGTDAPIVSQIADSITSIIPGAREIFLSNIQNIVDQRSSLGWFGFVFLLLMSTILFTSIENSLNKIFNCTSSRSFLNSRLLSIGVIAIVLLFLCLPSVFRLLDAGLDKYGYSFPIGEYIHGKYFSVIFAFLAFIVTVKIIPHKKVNFRYAFIGGIIYTLGIAVAKYIFQWYIGISFSRYNVVYGSLTAVILSVIWIYYLVLIFLISAEVVAQFQRRH